MNARSRSQANSTQTSAAVPTGLLQRKCSCANQAMARGACDKCEGKQGRLQRKSLDHSTVNQTQLVSQVLRSGGQPLHTATLAFFEPRFGHDFSRVRIHAGAQASDSAKAVNALAYTVGRHIVFGARGYEPHTSAGQRLLAHELTHVVQQSGASYSGAAPGDSKGDLEIGPPNDAFEREADQMAAQLGSRPKLRVNTVGAQRVQRVPIAGSLASHRSGTLPYREATELLECERIMGVGSQEYCREEVLHEAPTPRPTHHQLAGITTPQAVSVNLNPDGTARFQLPGVNVVFEPDVHSSDPAMANRAETTQNITFGAISWNTAGGRVTSVTGPGTAEIRIRTTYGPGATRQGPSGYGRGTTPGDVATRDTSLGFHEAQHGLDFVEFLSQNPLPRFSGRARMTVTQIQTAQANYQAAITAYSNRLNRFSELRTDCVGRTIDQLNLANGLVTTICRVVAAGGRPRP